MSAWEFKVVPAPTKGLKARGVKSPEDRFALALETLMNDMGADGWEFQRAETLPSTERSGLTGSTTEWRNVMVFRRAVPSDTADFEHELLPPPDVAHSTEPQGADAAQNEPTQGADTNTHQAASGRTEGDARDAAKRKMPEKPLVADLSSKISKD